MFFFDRSENDRYCPACLEECDRDELGEDNLLNREKVIVNLSFDCNRGYTPVVPSG